ncbi:MAG: hypothetical protein ACXVDV_15855, partial [Bacteroidia bacterium]
VDTNLIPDASGWAPHIKPRFYNDPFLGQTETFLFKESVTYAQLSGFNCDSIFVLHDSILLELDSINSNVLYFKSFDRKGRFESLNISRSHIKTLTFEKISLSKDKILFTDDNPVFSISHPSSAIIPNIVDVIKIKDCNILSDIKFENLPCPRCIFLDDIDFVNSNAVIDLTEFESYHDGIDCDLIIKNISNDISKIKMNYANFKVIFLDMPNWKRESVYKAMLENQLKQGYIFGYQKLDKEFKHFEYTKDSTYIGGLKDWMDEWWWDYGYNKIKVITNSVYLFGWVLLANLLLYPQLLKIYFPDKFRKIEERLVDRFGNLKSLSSKVKFYLYRMPSVVVYTAYLFWGLKLDIREIEIRKPAIFIILILEYIIGVVCLAYIANYIISK